MSKMLKTVTFSPGALGITFTWDYASVAFIIAAFPNVEGKNTESFGTLGPPFP